MAEPKIRPAKREAGKSKFRLPERPPRPVEENPLRELLKEAKAQEEALEPKAPEPLAPAPDSTPVKEIAGVSRARATRAVDTPAISFTGVSATPVDEAAGAPSLNTFAEFSRRWSPILRSGQMGICRALFEMTYAVGQTECFTSMPKLAEAAGLKERQCYNVVAQLELLGFIERPQIFNTPTQKGTVFKLHMEPRPPADRSERRYYIGGEGKE